jgi:hypothetical protein
MKATQRLCYLALLMLVSISISPRVLAQDRGSYSAAINYPAGPPTSPTNTNFYLGGISPLEIHYGDFNGDGKLDVIAASNCGYYPFNAWCPINGSIIVVYLNNGDGTFQAPILSGLTLPNSIRSMAVGDFNGDGKLDVVVGDDGGASGGDLTGVRDGRHCCPLHHRRREFHTGPLDSLHRLREPYPPAVGHFPILHSWPTDASDLRKAFLMEFGLQDLQADVREEAGKQKPRSCRAQELARSSAQ